MKYTFIIPAYNEQDNIPAIYERVVKLIENETLDFEIIFINDGSVDNTLSVLKTVSGKDKRVKIIDFTRNFGHQTALSAGMKYACGQAIISMDCDLQDPPEVIQGLIDKWKEGFKIVYARRTNFRKDNFIKKIGSKIYYKSLKRFSKIEIPENVGDFRLIDKCVLRELNKMPEHSRYLRGMVAWTGFKHTFVEYYRPDRAEGKSAYTLSKLAGLGMDGILNFSSIPLKIGFYVGVISFFTGIGLLAYQIFDFLFNHAYYHLYKWLIVLIFIFKGLLFMLVWILGEYIGKIYNEVRNRPLYILNETINLKTDTPEKENL